MGVDLVNERLVGDVCVARDYVALAKVLFIYFFANPTADPCRFEFEWA